MSQTPSSPEAEQPAAAPDACWGGEYGPRREPPSCHAADAGEWGIRTCGRNRLALVTVERLIRCRRLCMQLQRDGREYVSSQELGKLLGCGPSAIRRDFAKLGKLGARGKGYRIARLIRLLEGLLGGGPVTAVLIGTAGLAASLLTRGGFARDLFRFVAAFDFDPGRAGARCDCLVVDHISGMPDVLRALDVDVGVLAVPETEAQEAAQLLAVNGVRAILNLTPAILLPQEGVVVSNIDLATELAKLAFCAANPRGAPGGTTLLPATSGTMLTPGSAEAVAISRDRMQLDRSAGTSGRRRRGPDNERADQCPHRRRRAGHALRP